MQKIQLDFSPNNPERQTMPGVPYEYAKQVYARLMASRSKHIVASMVCGTLVIEDHNFYLFRQPRGYTFGVSDPTFDPRIQQITAPSVLDVLNLANIPSGFAYEFCPMEAWRDPPFPTFCVNDQGLQRTRIECGPRTMTQAMDFLSTEATAQDLQEIFEDLAKIEVAMAWGGSHVGQETIQERFWGWRKGTPRIDIETALLFHPRWKKDDTGSYEW